MSIYTLQHFKLCLFIIFIDLSIITILIALNKVIFLMHGFKSGFNFTPNLPAHLRLELIPYPIIKSSRNLFVDVY